ncbi:MAG: hypothetical protein DHS20C18_09230 [Saprospiraceae bacterium]|nr:MAG: hypothetical protein DHS20C18_09230 [Saprospiraceae bacterium]
MIKIHTQFQQFQQDKHFGLFEDFVNSHAFGNFFQSSSCFQYLEDVPGYAPFLITSHDESGAIQGSLLGVFQSNGSNIKSWFSRRLIVWGGPLVKQSDETIQHKIAHELIQTLNQHATGKAIYIEFRNFFDTTAYRNVFEASGFQFKEHLNYLVKTDEEAAVRKRVSKSRMRQIKSSLNAGATIAEAASKEEVITFYGILEKLYKEKVKKPLPALELFLKLRESPAAKLFVVKHEEQVVGGILCPIFNDTIIYEWYVCGEDGLIKGLHPSVLATWAPIEFGLKNNYSHFDFMGAGKPDQDYGVREFKARFGGEEVGYGRYEKIVNKSLYKAGKLGLKLYQSIK